MKNSKSTLNQKLNLRKEVGRYLKYWYWFLLGAFVFSALGFLYIKYSIPIYKATASIIVRSEGRQASGVETSIYSNLGMSNDLGTNNMENELGILKSKRIMREVVKSLNLNIQYFKEDGLKSTEVYEDAPFTIKVLKMDEDKLRELGGASFAISKLKNSEFMLSDEATGKIYKIIDGEPFKMTFANMVLTQNVNRDFEGMMVAFNEVDKIATHYINAISFLQTKDNSNLIMLELKDPVKEKARDILNQVVMEYNRDVIDDKNMIARNTANFINERLAIINEELDSVESGKETFKKQNLLTDIESESQLFVQNASDFNQKLEEINTQLELTDAMMEYIATNSKSDLLPANLGISETGVNEQINEYNELVLDRNRILQASSERNPMVVRLNSQIGQIKSNVMASLGRLRSSLQISQEDINRQSSRVNSKIFSVPGKEREYRGIERQQSIKETLYLFLLQKREENTLSLAVTEPKAKIVDRAYISDVAVFPNPRSIYLGSLILGLFIPFSVIYTKDLMDDKVRSRKDVEALSSNIPISGTLPRIVNKKKSFIEKNDRSELSEAFRILITNLQYLLVNSKKSDRAKTLMVTSTVKGEGKTFTAINLSITLANTGKKVLLIGGDLRNPKLQSLINEKSPLLGVTDYLVNSELCPKKLINNSIFHDNLDILTSGSIPPNPYELLNLDRFGGMIHQLENEYDYLIVDSAPSLLVADTFLISDYADLILYIVRAGYTEKELLHFPVDSYEEGKLPNLTFVLNDIKAGNFSYGNKYGYGYSNKKKSIWK